MIDTDHPQYWELKAIEDTYEPPRIQPNQALAWLDTDELYALKEAVTDNFVAALKTVQRPVITKDENLMWVRRSLYEYEVNQIMEHYKPIGRRIKARLSFIEWPEEERGGVSDLQIENAREYPIAELYAEIFNYPIKAGMTKCGFHPDKTASMSLRKHNRYHCFGCDAKGDAIELYMKGHGVDFVTAVNAYDRDWET
jgi:hypothetical protein